MQRRICQISAVSSTPKRWQIYLRERVGFVQIMKHHPPYFVIGRIGSWPPSHLRLVMGSLIKMRDLLRRMGLPVDKMVSYTSLHCGLKIGISFDVLNGHPIIDTLMLSKGGGGWKAHDWESEVR